MRGAQTGKGARYLPRLVSATIWGEEMLTTKISRVFALAVGLAAPMCANAQTTKMIYKFKGGADGANPYGKLIDVGGTLYATTAGGGSGNCSGGCGTVFAVTPAGAETVVYSFKGGSDGAGPLAGLINVGGKLYGTTFGGGESQNCSGGCGTVFAVTPSGSESIVYTFKGGADGANPYASLINVDGNLYGTTFNGGGSTNCGATGCGTVFEVTPSGSETILHAFAGNDGAAPEASLIDLKGTLYGTTFVGGANCGGDCGTVFSVTLSGKESVLYSFKGTPSDGSAPAGGVLDVAGTLYGTTLFGGDSPDCGGNGCGIAFALKLDGTETVLHTFRGATVDGSFPVGGFINVGGTLFGTTQQGGNSGNKSCQPYRCGTVFQMTTAGAEMVLHSFPNAQIGYPKAGLLYIKAKGAFYGTTSGQDGGYGEVFKLTP